MPSVSKSRSKWRVRIRLHGLPSVSKVFKTKQTAKIWGHKTEQAMMIGALLPDQDCNLCDLLERYGREITPTKRSGCKEILRINKICGHPIGSIRLSNLTSNHIAKYRDERLRKVSGTTVVKDLNILSLVIKTAMTEWGSNLPSNPVASVKKPKENKARDRRLREGGYERLVKECGERKNYWFKPLVVVALETGMRRGELLSLE